VSFYGKHSFVFFSFEEMNMRKSVLTLHSVVSPLYYYVNPLLTFSTKQVGAVYPNFTLSFTRSATVAWQSSCSNSTDVNSSPSLNGQLKDANTTPQSSSNQNELNNLPSTTHNTQPPQTKDIPLSNYLRRRFESVYPNSPLARYKTSINAPPIPDPSLTLTHTRFEDLPLSPDILQPLSSLGFTHATPTQAESIPYILKGRDIVGVSNDGSGKTLAYALPLLQLITELKNSPTFSQEYPTLFNYRHSNKACNPLLALILTHSFPQSLKIAKVFQQFRIPVSYAVNTQNHVHQLNEMYRGGILIGTPQRLLNYNKTHTIKLNTIRFLIIDDLEGIVDKRFLHSMKKLCEVLPPDRQTLIFTTSFPLFLKNEVKNIIRNPVVINVTEEPPPPLLPQQFSLPVEYKNKSEVLMNLIAFIFENNAGE
jgi:hypothetical protein